MFSSEKSEWEKPKHKPSTIHIDQKTLDQLSQTYKSLPSYQMEFGGVLCGRNGGDHYDIDWFNWIPSMHASPNSFSIQNDIVNQRDLFCGNKEIVGIFHTHSPDVPYPSSVDIITSKKLHTIGCVVAPQDNQGKNMLHCFDGEKKLQVDYI